MSILDQEEFIIKQCHLRKLKMNNEGRKKKYLLKVQEQWDLQQVDMKFRAIKDMIKNKREELNLELFLNNLDATITNILRHAEKKCTSTIRDVTVPWSPRLHNAIIKIRNIRMAVKQAKKLSNISFVQQSERYQQLLVELKEAKDEY